MVNGPLFLQETSLSAFRRQDKPVTRAGREEEAIKRLLLGIHDEEVREILIECLNGTITASVALKRMLAETKDVVAVRAAVDGVTRRAADLSRSGDSLLRDRVDDLTRLLLENERGINF